MTTPLHQAFERASELPREEQDRFARFIMAELESGASVGGTVQPSRI